MRFTSYFSILDPPNFNFIFKAAILWENTNHLDQNDQFFHFDSLASLVASEGRESRSRLGLETKGTETLGLVLNL